MSWSILTGDARVAMRDVPDGSVGCCVTSPPYWRLRDYGEERQIGLEDTVEEYVAELADVFDEVRRVLADTGTLWLNLGDSYVNRGGDRNEKCDTGVGRRVKTTPARKPYGSLKDGDLAGIPWEAAFALRSRGWYLRGEQIWEKTNPIPEGTQTRPGRAHETVFLLTKSRTDYTYNKDAVRVPLAPRTLDRAKYLPPSQEGYSRKLSYSVDDDGKPLGACLRSVWRIATNANRRGLEHTAMMPHRLARLCIRAGSKPGDLVLDPFCGAGTTGIVALRLGRSFLGVDISPSSAELARAEIIRDLPLINSTTEISA